MEFCKILTNSIKIRSRRWTNWKLRLWSIRRKRREWRKIIGGKNCRKKKRKLCIMRGIWKLWGIILWSRKDNCKCVMKRRLDKKEVRKSNKKLVKIHLIIYIKILHLNFILLLSHTPIICTRLHKCTHIHPQNPPILIS